MKIKHPLNPHHPVAPPTIHALLYQKAIECLVAHSPLPIERLVVPVRLYIDMGMPESVATVPPKRLFVHWEKTIAIGVQGTALMVHLQTDFTDDELQRLPTALPAAAPRIWRGFLRAAGLAGREAALDSSN